MYTVRNIIDDGMFDSIELSTSNGGMFALFKDGDVYTAVYFHDWEAESEAMDDANDVEWELDEMGESYEYFIDVMLENMPTMVADGVDDEVRKYMMDFVAE